MEDEEEEEESYGSGSSDEDNESIEDEEHDDEDKVWDDRIDQMAITEEGEATGVEDTVNDVEASIAEFEIDLKIFVIKDVSDAIKKRYLHRRNEEMSKTSHGKVAANLADENLDFLSGPRPPMPPM